MSLESNKELVHNFYQNVMFLGFRPFLSVFGFNAFLILKPQTFRQWTQTVVKYYKIHFTWYLGGVGFGLIYLPAIVSVGYYFTTRRALATGLAVCGSGIGAFLFAPFTQWMLTKMDWKNTLMILAALALHCSVFGALMRPLNVHAEAIIVDDTTTRNYSPKTLIQTIADEKRRRLLSHSNSEFLLMMQNTTPDEQYDEYNTLKERLMMNSMNTEPGVHSTLYLDQLFSPPPPPPSQSQPQQLSPIMERKVTNSENASPESSIAGSPPEEKGMKKCFWSNCSLNRFNCLTRFDLTLNKCFCFGLLAHNRSWNAITRLCHFFVRRVNFPLEYNISCSSVALKRRHKQTFRQFTVEFAPKKTTRIANYVRVFYFGGSILTTTSGHPIVRHSDPLGSQ